MLTGLNAGSPASLTVNIAYIRNTPASLHIYDANNVGLGNISISGPGTYTVSFTPTTGTATVEVQPLTSFTNSGNLVIVNSATFTQVNGIIYSPQLVAVSNNVFDKYEFGYNGQLKDNEVVGVGNHNTALFWEYDTRTAFRWNRDPVIIPFLSPYSVYRQNPILFPDIEGDCVGADCDQQSGSVKYKGNPQDSENGAEMEDFVFSVPQTKNKDKSSCTVNGARYLDNEYVKWLRHDKDGNGDPNDYFEYYQKMRSVENLSTNAFARAHELGYSPVEALAIAVSIPVNGTMAAGGSGSINMVIGQTCFGMGHTVGPSFGTPDGSVGLSIGIIQNVKNPGAPIVISEYLDGFGNSTTSGIGPVFVNFSQSIVNKRPAYNTYSFGMSFLTTRDLPSPFVLSYTHSPVTYSKSWISFEFYNMIRRFCGFIYLILLFSSCAQEQCEYSTRKIDISTELVVL